MQKEMPLPAFGGGRLGEETAPACFAWGLHLSRKQKN